MAINKTDCALLFRLGVAIFLSTGGHKTPEYQVQFSFSHRLAVWRLRKPKKKGWRVSGLWPVGGGWRVAVAPHFAYNKLRTSTKANCVRSAQCVCFCVSVFVSVSVAVSVSVFMFGFVFAFNAIDLFRFSSLAGGNSVSESESSAVGSIKFIWHFLFD